MSMRRGVWIEVVGTAWLVWACAGQAESADGEASIGGQPPGTGGTPAAGGVSAASGGVGEATGGDPLGAGGQATDSGGAATDGEPTGMSGASGDGPCAKSCSAELETCVAGSCQANDAVRAQTPMVEVRGGTFLMGEEDSTNSSPVHERTVQDFWLDQTEVTAGAYDLCVHAGSCTAADLTGLGVNSGSPGFEDYPANYVTLRQAETYCAWLGKRLPTEAEWEYAAGGRQGWEYPWGDGSPAACQQNITSSMPIDANVHHGCAVGQFPANENGIQDMGGGVYEYTSSPFCRYAAETESGYLTGCDPNPYALRDAAFSSFSIELAKIAFRQQIASDVTHQSLGFRCASGAVE